MPKMGERQHEAIIIEQVGVGFKSVGVRVIQHSDLSGNFR